MKLTSSVIDRLSGQHCRSVLRLKQYMVIVTITNGSNEGDENVEVRDDKNEICYGLFYSFSLLPLCICTPILPNMCSLDVLVGPLA